MGRPIWKPSEDRIKSTNMYDFIQFVNQKYNRSIKNYKELHEWSVKFVEEFWTTVWGFGDIKASKPYDTVISDPDKMPGAKWFSGARLNFAENLLRYRNNRTAITFKGETTPPVNLTYEQLHDQVSKLAKAMRDSGVSVGDRVAGFMPNMPETVIAMLATTSIGAIWSSCSPDFGITGVLDRFGQIEPKVLFTANGYSYNGKTFDSIGRMADILKQLPSIEKVIVVPYIEEKTSIEVIPNAIFYNDFLDPGRDLDIVFEQLPFDHPLYIMYSSGTTGVPKCIVHGAGGTLIQHLKELILHTDLKQDDTIFYFTTCGWMMWNWLVSSLAVGARLFLYDGSPFYPDAKTLPGLIEKEKITIFGTSAKYLESLEKAGVKPTKEFDTTSLKAILSTGSPLSVESFEFAYRAINNDFCLSSISGGTDIVSCFALGNPMGNVYSGELQCRGLGMNVKVFDEQGNPVAGRKGELVCTAPFPSMPVYFWNDPENKKYLAAYFDIYPNIWCHGDFAEITENDGVIIYGRSDATLNPGGVRIGTAEIYRQVESLDEVADSLVIGQNWENDVRVILFVKLFEGANLNDSLVNKIKTTIRQNTTPRHMPAKIIPIRDIPYTISGKKVELAVKNIIHGIAVLNRDALSNPESLELYRDIKELSQA